MKIRQIDTSCMVNAKKVLNIFRPAEFVGPLPIMIFIHGGAFQSGSNYDARLYNGTSLALLENIGFVANIF